MRSMNGRVRALVLALGLLAACPYAMPAAGAAPLAGSVTGGDLIWGSQYRCTAGVNVTNGAGYYLIIPGHCGNVEPNWWTADGEYIGSTVASSFPGNDFAIVQYGGDVAHPGTIGSQDVTSAGDAYPGESVCMRGGVSGVVCGTVDGIGVTVTFPGGRVESGVVRTNICSLPGDDGGPLYDGTTALGILVGADADGCASYFQPITEPLAAYGVSVY